ncbi:protein MAM3, putative, partial [Plasmodium reichenowi]
FFFFFFRMLL